MAITIRNERMIHCMITCHARIIEASARIETGIDCKPLAPITQGLTDSERRAKKTQPK